MKAYWEKYQAFVDGKVERERIIIIAMLLALIFFLADLFLLGGLLDKRSMQAESLASITRDTQATQFEIENLKASETSLGGSNKQRRDSYSQTLAQLSDTLAVITEGFIPASAMPVALEQILKSSKNLSLLSLENKPVELISGAGPDQNAYLYRHGVQMKMRGSYVASMAYLKKLEQLKWRIEWDTMTFTIEEYPQGLLTIDVYTYSNEKDWISV